MRGDGELSIIGSLWGMFGCSAIYFGIAYLVSKNKERGMLITATVLAFIWGLGGVLALINGHSISTVFGPFVYVIVYILFVRWRKLQKAAYENRANVINDIIGKHGYCDLQGFLNFLQTDPAYSKTAKMRVRNPEFVPEDPKQKPYTITYIEAITPLYLNTLYRYEIGQSKNVIEGHISKNGYVLPEEFESYCQNDSSTAVARSINYAVWMVGGRFEDDPFSNESSPFRIVAHVLYPELMRFLYEKMLRERFVSDMTNKVNRYIEEKGFTTWQEFAVSDAVESDAVAKSIVYDVQGFQVTDGKIIPILENTKIRLEGLNSEKPLSEDTYTMFIIKQYGKAVENHYMNAVHQWAKTQYILDYSDACKGLLEFNTFFSALYDGGMRQQQCFVSILDVMIQNHLFRRLLGDDGSEIYKSLTITEAEANANGLIENGETFYVDDDD